MCNWNVLHMTAATVFVFPSHFFLFFSHFSICEKFAFVKIPLARILSSSMLFVTFLIYLCFSLGQTFRLIWNVCPLSLDFDHLCWQAPCCVYSQHVYAPLSSYLFYIHSFQPLRFGSHWFSHTEPKTEISFVWSEDIPLKHRQLGKRGL